MKPLTKAQQHEANQIEAGCNNDPPIHLCRDGRESIAKALREHGLIKLVEHKEWERWWRRRWVHVNCPLPDALKADAERSKAREVKYQERRGEKRLTYRVSAGDAGLALDIADAVFSGCYEDEVEMAKMIADVMREDERHI